jgi:hypothetical protein
MSIDPNIEPIERQPTLVPKPVEAEIPRPALEIPAPVEPLFNRTITNITAASGIIGKIKAIFLSIFSNLKKERLNDLVQDQQDLYSALQNNSATVFVKRDGESFVEINPSFFKPPGLDNSFLPSKSELLKFSKEYITGKAEEEVQPLDGSVYAHGHVAKVTLTPCTSEGSKISLNRVAGTAQNDNKLKNLYVVDMPNLIGIRSGAIDTSFKSIDFYHAIPSRGDGVPVRVISNQLCSFERKNEKTMIKRQHRFLSHLNHKTKNSEKPTDIAHINTATNRFYDTHRFWHKIFGSPVDTFIKGEARSRDQNIEGLSGYLQWCLEDAGHAQLAHELKSRRQNIDDIHTKLIVAKGQDRKTLKESLAQERFALQTHLNNAKNILTEVRFQGGEIGKSAEILLKIISSHLEPMSERRLERDHEQLLLKDLNHRLRIVSAVNCKSGLDRTGQASAVEMALHQLRAIFPNDQEKIDDMILNWPAKKNSSDPIVNEFKNFYLINLIKTGLPITFRSTGFFGLKWGKGFQAQLVPLQYLPSHVMVKGGKIPLVLRNEAGEIESLTPEGQRLLLWLSTQRGA